MGTRETGQAGGEQSPRMAGEKEEKEQKEDKEKEERKRMPIWMWWLMFSPVHGQHVSTAAGKLGNLHCKQ